MSATTTIKSTGLVAAATAALFLSGQGMAATVTADYIGYDGGSAEGAVQVVAGCR